MKVIHDNLGRLTVTCLMAICVSNSTIADNVENDIDIIGTVYDVNDNSPLSAATVYIEELEKGVITDTEGVFRITGIPEGTYTLKAQYLGYNPTEKIVKRHTLY